MSLAGRQRRWAFWGTFTPVLLSILLLIVTAGFGVWNSLEPLAMPPFGDIRFYPPILASMGAALLTGLDRHFAGKKSKRSAEAVSERSFEVLTNLEYAMGKLSDEDEFQAYFDDLVRKCAPKMFREREVRIGFYVLEAGEDEDTTLQFLGKRTAFDQGNMMPLSYRPGKVEDGQRDHAEEMIRRTHEGKDLCVKNIYKDSQDWPRLEKSVHKAYKCFVSAPVLDSKRKKSLGLLTIDAPSVGDLTDRDRKWVRVLAGMLSHGLRDEVAAPPVPMSPVLLPAPPIPPGISMAAAVGVGS